MTTQKQFLEAAKKYEKPMVKFLRDMIAIPSESAEEGPVIERIRKEMPAGVATGLAWTETGGEVLYIEAALLPRAPGLRLTGQLGRVMRESARAAQSYVWSHADLLGIPQLPE